MKIHLPASLLFTLFISNHLYAQQLALGQWRDELVYRNAYSVTASDNKVYCAATIAFYSVDLTDNSMEKFSKVNGLSDIQTTLLSYDKSHDLLVICYANSNIDIMKDGIITNVSDIERKSIVGDKAIYGVYIYGDYAYFSCGFGIVVYDVIKNEIKDTYYIGPNGSQLQVNDVAIDGTNIYAATISGMYFASLSDPFLADFSRWHLFTPEEGLQSGSYTDCITFNNLVLAAKKDTIFQFNSGVWAPYFYFRPGLDIRKMEVSSDALLVSQIGSAGARVTVIHSAGQIDSIYTPQPLQAVEASGAVWIADLYNGLQKSTEGNLESFYPDGPYSKNVFDLAINSNTHSVYVAPGGWNSSYGFIFNQDGFFAKIDGFWNHYDINNTNLIDTFDIVCVTVNPVTNLTYFGSLWKGIVEFDDKLGITNQYDENNSSLSGTNGDIRRVKASDIAFDQYGNMWVSNFGALDPICVRKADGTWLDFQPPFPISQQWITNIAFDDFNQVWFVLPRQGIMVFNYGNTLDDPSDDQYKLLINVPGSGGLPSLSVNCITKDKDGTIWAGTESGVAVFYCPGDEFSEFGCDAQQIVVNSGGYNGYLLETENVRQIVIDGANQKWIGTDNGIWLFSADGTEQILHLTTENSPIFSNFIDALAIDNSSGEVYIGTDNGLIVYRGEATTGSASSCAPMVYPNPVRESYDGPIAISGMVDNADVKITDEAGILIYRTQAQGGQVVWDGKNYSGVRAKTGVYLVWASNTDASVTCVTKLLIIN
ncbi:MAG: two-component regulator propeller domain-containing protein [Chitinophagales bacterium]